MQPFGLNPSLTRRVCVHLCLLVCVALLAPMRSASVNAQPTALAQETPGSREVLVRRFVAAFNAHDPQAVAAPVTDDVEWLDGNGPDVGEEAVGKAALAAAMTNYFKGCVTCRSTLASIAATRARATTIEVAVWQTPSGTRQQQSIAVYEFSGPLIRRVHYFPSEPADSVSAAGRFGVPATLGVEPPSNRALETL